jgi:hypothetical protein
MIQNFWDILLKFIGFGNKSRYNRYSKPKWRPSCWYYKPNYKSKQCALAYENFCSDQSASIAIASGYGILTFGRYSVPTSIGFYCEHNSDKIYCPYD